MDSGLSEEIIDSLFENRSPPAEVISTYVEMTVGLSRDERIEMIRGLRAAQTNPEIKREVENTLLQGSFELSRDETKPLRQLNETLESAISIEAAVTPYRAIENLPSEQRNHILQMLSGMESRLDDVFVPLSSRYGDIFPIAEFRVVFSNLRQPPVVVGVFSSDNTTCGREIWKIP